MPAYAGMTEKKPGAVLFLRKRESGLWYIYLQPALVLCVVATLVAERVVETPEVVTSDATRPDKFSAPAIVQRTRLVDFWMP